MKRWHIIFLCISILLLSACHFNRQTLEEARAEGYKAGYSAAKDMFDSSDHTRCSGYDEGFEKGYESGYEEAMYTVLGTVEDALDAANKDIQCSIQEACDDIYLYLGSTDYLNHGTPSQAEFEQAAKLLAIFAEYLNNSNVFGF